jgi:4-diphosphocytidyl-2-C-methyl-D-erythritol kinase
MISSKEKYNIKITENQAKLKLIAQAKVNLNLDILGKRADGYHELHSVMQSLALHDIILLIAKKNEKPQTKINLTSDKVIIKDIKENIAYRSAQAFLDHFALQADLEIYLNKKIPLAAGLAGGSANAAAVLRGLGDLFNDQRTRTFFKGKRQEPISKMELLSLASTIGADVSFSLHRGTALCEGIGEKISPLRSFTPKPVLIFSPQFTTLTKEAFQWLNAPPLTESAFQNLRTATMYNQMFDQGLKEMNAQLKNDFTPALINKFPELNDVFAAFSETGAPFVRLTGSGPTIYAIYDSYVARDSALAELNKLNLPGTFISTYTQDAWD